MMRINVMKIFYKYLILAPSSRFMHQIMMTGNSLISCITADYILEVSRRLQINQTELSVV